MESAILGIIGVIVGALVTGGADYLRQRRNDWYDRRAAIRLLCADLYKVIAVTEEVAASGQWGPENGPLPEGGYELNAATLARVLPADAWKRVEGSVLGVRRMEGIRTEMIEAARVATAEEVEDFRRIREFIQRTLETLDRESWAIERSTAVMIN